MILELGVERPDREPPRCMFPGEFLSLLRRFKAPKFDSCGVDYNRWGKRSREDVGIPENGTVWFATPDGDVVQHPDGNYRDEDGKTLLFLIPCDCIPFDTMKLSKWDPDAHRFKIAPRRGWRAALIQLAKSGLLRPDLDLAFLTGKRLDELARKSQ